MRKFLLLWLLLAVLCSAHSQSLTGKVLQISENGDTTVVPNAAVQWLHTDIGAYTDSSGKFTLPRTKTDTLVISPEISFPLSSMLLRRRNTSLRSATRMASRMSLSTCSPIVKYNCCNQ